MTLKVVVEQYQFGTAPSSEYKPVTHEFEDLFGDNESSAAQRRFLKFIQALRLHNLDRLIVIASGSTLEQVNNTMTELPIGDGNSCRWDGDLAKFVLYNLLEDDESGEDEEDDDDEDSDDRDDEGEDEEENEEPQLYCRRCGRTVDLKDSRMVKDDRVCYFCQPLSEGEKRDEEYDEQTARIFADAHRSPTKPVYCTYCQRQLGAKEIADHQLNVYGDDAETVAWLDKREKRREADRIKNDLSADADYETDDFDASDHDVTTASAEQARDYIRYLARLEREKRANAAHDKTMEGLGNRKEPLSGLIRFSRMVRAMIIVGLLLVTAGAILSVVFKEQVTPVLTCLGVP